MRYGKGKLLLGAMLVLAACAVGAADVLVFCGGRMFAAGFMRRELERTGAKVKMIDSTRLAGFGGVSTKVRVNDPKEPEPPKADGITPEFARLGEYRVVMFNSIPPRLLEEMLTPERIAALEAYVRGGGALILNSSAPAALGGLLPVKFTGGIRPGSGHTMIRPRHAAFRLLPEKWEKLAAFRPAVPVPGAETLAEITDSAGNFVAVGVAKLPLGKGTVWFCNGDFSRSNRVRELWKWAYGSASIAALIAAAGDLPLDVSRVIRGIPEPPARREHAALTIRIAEPVSELAPVNAVRMSGPFAQFANGVKIHVRKDGVVEVIFPEAGREKLKLQPPMIQISGAPEQITGNEAIIDRPKVGKYRCRWTLRGSELKGDALEATYDGSDGSVIRWVFRGSDLTLDGRKFAGFSENIVVDKMPILLESLAFNAVLPPGAFRRCATYSRPRGYLAGSLDAGTGIRDSGRWQMFCGGQPFGYYTTAAGLLLEFPAEPVPCYVNYRAFKTSAGGQRQFRMILGRRKAPVELPAMRHFFSPGAERGNNDFMAAWQFIRRELRRQCGIKTFPMRTCAGFYLHGVTDEHLERVMAAAAKYEFTSVFLFFGQAAMSFTAGDRAAKFYAAARKHGLVPHPWTAGGYADSIYDPDYTERPEVYLKDRNGRTHLYGKKLPVLDFNDPKALEWYFAIMKRAIERGLGEVYMDMMGQASSNVNYAGGAAMPNLEGVIRVFRFWSDHNIPFALEGMNPLGRDQALFRASDFTPLSGREFAYVGGSPLTSADVPALNFDYFRLLMYNATTNVSVDGIVENFDRFPGETAQFERIARINRLFNRAFAAIPDPWVRETPCGTLWLGETRGALFFWDKVKKLTLELPPGWRVAPGQDLADIPSETAVFLEKVR